MLERECVRNIEEATNENDTKALYAAAQGAKDALEKTMEESITVLADKGYHNGEQLHRCAEANIETLVANRERTGSKELPSPDYFSEKFLYDKESHSYTCPQGQTLTTNGSWYNKDHSAHNRKNSTQYLFQQFKTRKRKSKCRVCNHLHRL